MPKTELIEKIVNKSAKVGVIGLGYVGLPFAVESAKAGFNVTGIDKSQDKVDNVNNTINYISDVLDDDLKSVIQNKKLVATTSFEICAELDIIIICVPTPLTKNLMPDINYIIDSTQEIAKYLHEGQLVSLESTTYPGTTEEVMLPILEKSGLKVESDFFLAHSPERVDPGNHQFKTKNTNKVVGGVGPESLEVALAFYSQTIDTVVPVSSAKAAELVKVFENTFRAVNIAVVNELALYCDRININVWEVLDAAFTKPFGIMPFYPGPGVGGHCIPLDPHYLEWKAKEVNFTTRFINLAGEINRSMPEFVRNKVWRVLNEIGVAPSRARILVIGVTYKKDVGDYRESPALDILKMLKKDGANITYHDPYVPRFIENGIELESVELTKAYLSQQDMILILTNHSNIDYNWLVNNSKVVLDTRNACKGIKSDKIRLL